MACNIVSCCMAERSTARSASASSLHTAALQNRQVLFPSCRFDAQGKRREPLFCIVQCPAPTPAAPRMPAASPEKKKAGRDVRPEFRKPRGGGEGFLRGQRAGRRMAAADRPNMTVWSKLCNAAKCRAAMRWVQGSKVPAARLGEKEIAEGPELGLVLHGFGIAEKNIK